MRIVCEGGGAEQACAYDPDKERVAASSPATGSVAPLMSVEWKCGVMPALGVWVAALRWVGCSD